MIKTAASQKQEAKNNGRFWLLAFGLLAFFTPTRAQDPAVGSARVVPIQVTGDDASRFTLVVMADGYTAADMPKFRQDLDKHLNILWSFEPYRSYRNYFNVYAVEAVSKDSGLTCDPALLEEPNMDPELRKKLQQKETVFGLNFGGGCTNINARGVTPSANMNAKVREYATKATPNPDQILIIGNSRTYGGIGGGIATSTGSNALSPLITPHEIGHSLGRLTDEYTYSQRGVAGGTYNASRGEPNNVHTTIMTADEMKAQQKKWWRWLGEPSEAGGVIGLYEGGSGNTKGIWRPSKHSIMISLGYAYDQVGREQMVKQISSKVGLIAESTVNDKPVERGTTICVSPAHPVYEDFKVTWTVDGQPRPNPNNLTYLSTSDLADGQHQVTVTVIDETAFVRDPNIRSTVLTASKTWTVNAQGRGLSVVTFGDITNSTQTQRAVGGQDVVYVDVCPSKASGYPLLNQPTWRLDNNIVADAGNKLSFPLAARKLAPGTHTLSVTVGLPMAGIDTRPSPGSTRSWTIDNTLPTVSYTLSTPVAQLQSANGVEPHFFMRDSFTMKLDPKDDQPGYVVAEFRVNGDGWHHYYGWPDAPPGTPFRFTARGTNIKELIYGSLSSEGLSPQPWEPREPGWGTHRIEYRAKDAAGNIGDAKAFRVSIMPAEKCDATVTGTRAGNLAITSGITCLDHVNVTGNVTVAPGASIVATNASISGTLTTAGAAIVELVATSINGDVKIAGTTGRVTIFGSSAQSLALTDSKTTMAPLVTGSTIKSALTCTGNSTSPTNGGTPNVAGSASGQCAQR